MKLRYQERTGRYSQVLPTLHSAIGQYQRGGRPIKIGLTVNPEQRAQAHTRGGWLEMVVVYSTSSANSVAAVEKDLINHGWRNNYYSLNYNRGGEGIAPGHPRYYVYVLLG
jgi:hypothetical protein